MADQLTCNGFFQYKGKDRARTGNSHPDYLSFCGGLGKTGDIYRRSANKSAKN
jgi:hypothetical protein